MNICFLKCFSYFTTLGLTLIWCECTFGAVRFRTVGSTPAAGVVVGQYTDGTGEWFVDMNNPPPANQEYHYIIKGDGHSVLRRVQVNTGSNATGTIVISIVKCDEGVCDGNGLSSVKIIEKTGVGQLRVSSVTVENDIYAFEADLIGVLSAGHDLRGGFVDPSKGFRSKATISVVETLTGSGGSLTTSIESTSGDIDEIRIDGQVLSDNNPSTKDINTPNGRINTIEVAGDIGTPSAPVSIYSAELAKITSIKARSIYADIDGAGVGPYVARMETTGTAAGTGDFGGTNRFRYIDYQSQTPIPGVYIKGDLVGTLSFTNGVSEPIVVEGSMKPGSLISFTSLADFPNESTISEIRDGRVVIKGDMESGAVIQAATNVVSRDSASGQESIRIEGAMASGALISIGQSLALDSGTQARIAVVPSMGLAGQIILNAGNATPTAWAGTVSVGGTTVPPGAYANLASSLGGGSVGLAPFRLHAADCTPPGGEGVTLAAAPTPSTPALLRMYGPVVFTGTQITIERCRADSDASDEGNWVPFSSCFDTSADPTNASLIRLAPKDSALQNGWRYRVKPILTGTDTLRCALVTDSPPVTAFTYTFCVGTTECADLNGDGEVNTADLTLFLASFGQGPACNLRGDFNSDTYTNTADLTYFLGKFGGTGFAACGASTTEFVIAGPGSDRAATASAHNAAHANTSQAPTPPGPVIGALGFTSVEAYDAWASTLTEEQARLHIIELFEIIKRLGLE